MFIKVFIIITIYFIFISLFFLFIYSNTPILYFIMSTETESTLRIKINDMVKKLSQLKSNVDLYTQVRSLQQELQILKNNYNLLQKNAETAKCGRNCMTLSQNEDPNSVDSFLIELLHKKGSLVRPPALLSPSAPQ